MIFPPRPKHNETLNHCDLQVGVKGSFSPMSETLAQLDKIIKDDVVRVRKSAPPPIAMTFLVLYSDAVFPSCVRYQGLLRLDQLLAEVSLKQ